VRIVFSLVIGMAAVAVRAADDTATADEQKVIDAVAKLPGSMKAAINPDLHKDARVVVKFKELSDGTLAALKKYPQVGGIETFDSTKCTEKGFGLLAEFPHLRVLKLGQSTATDKTAGQLAECSELRLLYVTQARLTDAGLEKLKKLTRLDALDVSGNKGITDAGMAHVKTLERLEILYLANTAVTDKGLFDLSPLEGLRTLNVVNTKVTAEAAMKFVDQMPNLRVVRR
jgi:hypothetical protein